MVTALDVDDDDDELVDHDLVEELVDADEDDVEEPDFLC